MGSGQWAVDSGLRNRPGRPIAHCPLPTALHATQRGCDQAVAPAVGENALHEQTGTRILSNEVAGLRSACEQRVLDGASDAVGRHTASTGTTHSPFYRLD